MSEHWRSDSKYSEHGVNGSLCSFLVYLSEVESFCPPVNNHGYIAHANDCKTPQWSGAFPNCEQKVEVRN